MFKKVWSKSHLEVDKFQNYIKQKQNERNTEINDFEPIEWSYLNCRKSEIVKKIK